MKAKLGGHETPLFIPLLDDQLNFFLVFLHYSSL